MTDDQFGREGCGAPQNKVRQGQCSMGRSEASMLRERLVSLYALRSAKSEETELRAAAKTANITRQEQVCVAAVPLPPRKSGKKKTKTYEENIRKGM